MRLEVAVFRGSVRLSEEGNLPGVEVRFTPRGDVAPSSAFSCGDFRSSRRPGGGKGGENSRNSLGVRVSPLPPPRKGPQLGGRERVGASGGRRRKASEETPEFDTYQIHFVYISGKERYLRTYLLAT